MSAPVAVPGWGTLARHEWRLLARERLPWLLGALLGLLMGYGAWNGWHWARFQREAIGRLAVEDAGRLASLDSLLRRREGGDTTAQLPPAGALGATGAVQHAVLPPSALGALAVGASDLLPYYAKVSTRSKESFFITDEVENPHHLLAGRFDLAFVVVYLLPLVVLALTYNVVAGEREQGTLALLMATPVPPRRLLLAKVGVRAGAVLGGTVGMTLLLVVATLWAGGSPLGAAATWGGVLLWLLLVLAYTAAWTALAFAVNLRGYGSATNAVVLLGGWLAVVVVAPALVSAGVSLAHPAPSRVGLTVALREATDAATREGEQAVAQYLADHPELLRTGTLAAAGNWGRTVALQERTAQAMRPVYAAFAAARDAQERAAARWRLASPAAVLLDALHDVAGRGVARHRHYERQVDAHHQAWQAAFFRQIFANQPFTRADLEALPRYQYREEPLAAAVSRVWPALLLLMALAVALGGWSWHRLGAFTPSGSA
jgi:ABC-2 type transport system permease protein